MVKNLRLTFFVLIRSKAEERPKLRHPIFTRPVLFAIYLKFCFVPRHLCSADNGISTVVPRNKSKGLALLAGHTKHLPVPFIMHCMTRCSRRDSEGTSRTTALKRGRDPSPTTVKRTRQCLPTPPPSFAPATRRFGEEYYTCQ